MPQDPNKLYSVHKTTIWFALASLVLTISLFLMVQQDYDREWKHWQRKFVAYEREKAEADLKKAESAVDQKKIETVQKQAGCLYCTLSVFISTTGPNH